MTFLRRQIGSRLRLKRAPELRFIYDDSIAGQDRIEQILSQLHGSADGPSGRDSLEPASSRATTKPSVDLSSPKVERGCGPASSKHDDDGS